MKASKLATAVALCMSLGLAPAAFAADKGMDMIKSMDADKDGMISKAEFVKMMEKHYDAMDKAKKGRLTTEDVAKAIKEIAATYGTAQ